MLLLKEGWHWPPSLTSSRQLLYSVLERVLLTSQPDIQLPLHLVCFLSVVYWKDIFPHEVNDRRQMILAEMVTYQVQALLCWNASQGISECITSKEIRCSDNLILIIFRKLYPNFHTYSYLSSYILLATQGYSYVGLSHICAGGYYTFEWEWSNVAPSISSLLTTHK